MAQSSLTEQVLLRYWRLLRPEQQRAALDYVEFLQSKSAAKQPRKSLLGILKADHEITSEDIDEVRREVWGNFPREM
jgi:hypothetical protein